MVTSVTSSLRCVPLTLAAANQLISQMHRHHRPVVGHRFTIGLENEHGLVGAVIVGRPVARKTDQQRVAEVTRLVTDGTPNACSMLYQAAARASKAMGYDRIQTFILQTDPGTSLKAAGWRCAGDSPGGQWKSDRRQGSLFDRPDTGPTTVKVRWIRDL